MRSDRSVWCPPLMALAMLAACSKTPETTTMSDVATDGGAPAATKGDDFEDAAPPAMSRSTDRKTVETKETSIGGVVSTRTTRTTTERVAMPMPTLPPILETDVPSQRGRVQPPVQSGLLTAGDYDDLLNPRAYATYASEFLQGTGRTIPFVDTRTRTSVKVVGSDGRPVPFARVAVQRRGAPLALTASADGVVSFYPGFDRVSGRPKVVVSSAAGRAETTVDVARGPQNVVVKVQGTARPVQALDIALVVDATGSMGDEIDYLQAEIEAILSRMRSNAGNVDIRIGLVAYRDEGDEYVTLFNDLSKDGAVQKALASLDASGGGDMPEAMDKAIAAAARMSWRPDAVKTMLIVADAPPHDDGIGRALDSVQSLRSRGVHVVPVAASGVDDTAQYVMRTMAAMTQGRYVFLTDDSGVGNPHAEPQVSCYLVTRLDGLIARVISGFVTGRRIEPRRQDVVREIGQYDRGRCAGEGDVPGQE